MVSPRELLDDDSSSQRISYTLSSDTIRVEHLRKGLILWPLAELGDCSSIMTNSVQTTGAVVLTLGMASVLLIEADGRRRGSPDAVSKFGFEPGVPASVLVKRREPMKESHCQPDRTGGWKRRQCHSSGTMTGGRTP